MEVCSVNFAGIGRHLISAFALKTGRSGCMKPGNTKSPALMASCRKLAALAAICLGVLLSQATAQGGELRFCLHNEPKTFDPQKVDDDAALSIRYLTGGVLVRLNRQTQQLEPELAESWKISKDGRAISFRLRSGIAFSDGTPFTADDVAYTMRQLMDPALHSPTGDTFRSSTGNIEAEVSSPTQISIKFPAEVSGLDRLFDQVAIVSGRSPKKEMAVLGPFMVADYKPGTSVLLKRNPNYWKRDEQGRKLPYLDSILLEIQSNRDVEMLQFKRGDLDLINTLDSEYFDKLAASSPQVVHDAGPSLDSEQLWFNEVAKAPIPQYKKDWFRSANFRRAISEAINREDLSRIVYHGHAQPAMGPFSPANKFWFDANLKPPIYSSDAALKALASEGFRFENGTLKDKSGNAVVFSIITNAGNKARERMAVLIQDDLQKIGVQVNVVTLDFPSLIERMTQSFDYEAIILGLTNVDLDPNAEMNVWLSSAENHQWNPQQKTPETAWEAEIDRLMRLQASSSNPKKRKEAFDRVQEIVVEEQPFIFLINKNALSAVSMRVHGTAPVILSPQTFWNAERLTVSGN
jgi:peptide/nickel transport system substrate-binding protein